jgi:hypothetical protein
MSTKVTTKKSKFPDWFPLTVYGKNHTDDNWLTEIALRAAVLIQRDNLKKDGKIVCSTSLEAFKAIFIKNKRTDGSLAAGPISNIWPVREPSPFELLFSSQILSEKACKEAKLWATRLHREPAKWIASFCSDGVREKLNNEKQSWGEVPYYSDIVGKSSVIWVDLDHDDKTLKLAFQVWLEGARVELGEKARSPIGEKEFAKWTRFKLLEAFDLAFWSDVNGLGYTDAYIAKTLWPDFSNENDFVDVTERYRKVTKPLVNEVFEWKFVQRLWSQVKLSNTLESLVAEMKVERKSG